MGILAFDSRAGRRRRHITRDGGMGGGAVNTRMRETLAGGMESMSHCRERFRRCCIC